MATKTTANRRLILARELRGWTQAEVAAALGVTELTVGRWERGETFPHRYHRQKLCELFEKSEQELGVSRVRDRFSAFFLPAHSTIINDPAMPPLTPLSGRDDEVKHIKQQLRSANDVALTGLPGIGKTALAIALVHAPEICTRFCDGILWVSLGPHPDLLQNLKRWGALLDISASQMTRLKSREQWTHAVRAAIGSRSMLLIIDDIWRLEEALLFKAGGPNCRYLFTTRFPTIAAYLAQEGTSKLEELNQDDSKRLLQLLAPTIVNGDEQKVQQLLSAVGGLPLALTLMGNELRAHAYDGQPRRINLALERLAPARERLQISEPCPPVATHTCLSPGTPLSLYAVIEASDRVLSEQARAAFYALSVFYPKPHGFSGKAALAVTACPIEIIDQLMDTGLLESTGSGRYTLHPVIADYTQIHLRDQRPYERLITYAIRYIEEHQDDVRDLKQERSTILAALDAARMLGKPTEVVQALKRFVP